MRWGGKCVRKCEGRAVTALLAGCHPAAWPRRQLTAASLPWGAAAAAAGVAWALAAGAAAWAWAAAGVAWALAAAGGAWAWVAAGVA
jgi:hypothetical protein